MQGLIRKGLSKVSGLVVFPEYAGIDLEGGSVPVPDDCVP